MTEKPTTESSMAAKLKGDGPITLTEDEANELRATLRGLFERDSRHPDISIADSLEGLAIAQWAFGYFVNHRVKGSLAGGLAELLTWAVLREFMNEKEKGVSATPDRKREAIDRAVDTFLADNGDAPDGTPREALIDVVCTALDSAAMALQPQTDVNPADAILH